jgi:RNA polymerase sigma-70 factor, ECF subfamily
MDFEEKVEPEVASLRRLASYLCPDQHMADEVVQRTLIRAYQQWEDFREGAEAGPWLRTILRYFVKAEIKELQRHGERKRRYRDEWLLSITLEDDGDADPTEHLDGCREDLAPASADLIRLKYEDDLSCKEIASTLDRSVSWVTTTLARVRSTLKVCLESRKKENEDEA